MLIWCNSTHKNVYGDRETDRLISDVCERHLCNLLPQGDTGQRCDDEDVTQRCDGTANRLTLTGPC